MNKLKVLYVVLVLAALIFPVSAQDAMAPAVEVANQVVVGSTVTVGKVVASGPSFIVIHRDNEGSFGPVIGYSPVNEGENTNVSVWIDAAQATPTLYAMLHVDDGAVGTYEFGTVEGADAPVVVDGAPVSPGFTATILNAWDQFVENDTFVAASVTVDAPSWLVIHAGDAASFGAVIGQTLVEPGTTADVAVQIATEGRTSVLWPMLHVDTGEAGTYEFGTVEGADGPIVGEVGGLASAPVWTVPHFRVDAQAVTHGDGMEMMGDPTIVVKSVLSEGAGWMVIHSENEGGPGPVAGQALLEPGLNTNVVVTLDPAVVTPVLWPMLHVDDGVAGEYEFGTVEGADAPVRVDDSVVTSPVWAAPAINYSVTMTADDQVTVASAFIDAPGWLVIHVDNGGAPGPVAGAAYLKAGWNSNVVITVDPTMMTPTVFPMLHYDTGVAGEYEFGTVDGADGPVAVGGNVVVGPAEVQPMP
jgi:hypothetical protein